MTSKEVERYLGLISGTSVDGIDAAIVDFDPEPKLIAFKTYPYSQSLRTSILSISQPNSNDPHDRVDQLGEIDQLVGKAFANAAINLCSDFNIPLETIRAIGSHGQTVRHRPDSTQPFTLQIGDPNQICILTNRTTVADFRRLDMAAGGQGAPLVPPFHHVCFFNSAIPRAILNLGGIANLSILSNSENEAIGFDTGPASCLMDEWIQLHKKTKFDNKGLWAKSGTINPTLLKSMLNDPYFKRPTPKSTGREYFNQSWLNQHLQSGIAPEDVQSTLAELTARSIADALVNYTKIKELIVCGGGQHNEFLISRLNTHLPNLEIKSADHVGFSSDAIEAMTFAWLAKQRLARKSSNAPSVTGAKTQLSLGAIYIS